MKICEISSSSKWNEAIDRSIVRLMLTTDGWTGLDSGRQRMEGTKWKPTYQLQDGIVMETALYKYLLFIFY